MSKRSALIIGVVAMGLAGAVVLGWLGLERWVLRTAVAQAAEAGVALVPGRLRLRWGAIALEDSSFRSTDRLALAGTVRLLEVRLEGLRPVGVHVVGVKARSELTRADLRGWLVQPPEGKREPSTLSYSGEEVALVLKEPLSSEAWLVLSGVSFEYVAGTGSARVASALLRGAALGSQRWAFTPSSLTLEEEASARGAGRYKGVAAWTNEALSLDVTVGPVALDDVTAWLRAGAPPSLPSGVISPTGSFTFRLEAPRVVTSEWVGDFEARLEGFRVTPKGPIASLGWFGTRVDARSRLKLDASLNRLTLSPLNVTVGSIALGGRALVDGLNAEAVLSVELRGQLSCESLVAAVLSANFGSMAAALAKKPIQRGVSGSLSYGYELESPLKDLHQAKGQTHLSQTCGLLLGEPSAGPTLELKLPTQQDLDWLKKLPSLLAPAR